MRQNPKNEQLRQNINKTQLETEEIIDANLIYNCSDGEHKEYHAIFMKENHPYIYAEQLYAPTVTTIPIIQTTNTELQLTLDFTIPTELKTKINKSAQQPNTETDQHTYYEPEKLKPTQLDEETPTNPLWLVTTGSYPPTEQAAFINKTHAHIYASNVDGHVQQIQLVHTDEQYILIQRTKLENIHEEIDSGQEFTTFFEELDESGLEAYENRFEEFVERFLVDTDDPYQT